MKGELAVYVGGIALALVSYVGLNFFGKPILALRETITEIAKSLVLYANMDSGVPNTLGERVDDQAQAARDRYRDLASTLHGQANSVPFYGLWSRLKIVPHFEAIQTAKANLIGLSNMLGRPNQGPDNSRRERHVRESLGIRE